MRPCLKLNSMKVDGDRVYRIDHGTQADAAGKQSRRRALTLVDYRSISKQISTVSRAIYLDGLESGTRGVPRAVTKRSLSGVLAGSLAVSACAPKTQTRT